MKKRLLTTVAIMTLFLGAGLAASHGHPGPIHTDELPSVY